MKLGVSLAIVGNGAAGAEAILALRDHGYEGEIHLFSENTRPPYNPMLGTYVLSGVVAEERAFPFGGDGFYEGNRVTTHLGQAVTQVDAERQVLTVADGTAYEYERCLVASGAHPSLPPIAGLKEAFAAVGPERRVFTMRTLDDALGLKAAVESLRTRRTGSARAAVIGASFVGVKVAEALRGLGLEVILIEREPTILPLSAHPDCARFMQEHLRAEGYELRLGAIVSGVEVGGRGPETIRVTYDHGVGTACEGVPTHDDADLAVVCTGIRPSLGFLVPGQVDTGEGILIDEHCRSSVPTLYAAGDVAQGKNVMSGRHEIIGLWASARYQGRAAGRSLAGAPSGYPGSVPHNITHVGRMLFASVGCMHDYDQATVCQEQDKIQVRVWQEGRLKGVNLLNRCHDIGAVKQALLRAATGAAKGTEVTWTSFND